MCDWTHEEMKEKETVSAKAKAKDIETFEKKEERPLTATQLSQLDVIGKAEPVGFVSSILQHFEACITLR
jgi:hypothetical protein